MVQKQTIAKHLGDAILFGLNINWFKFKLTEDILNQFDRALTEKLNRILKDIKSSHVVWMETNPSSEQYCDQYWISLALIKRKYGIGSEISTSSVKRAIESPKASSSSKKSK